MAATKSTQTSSHLCYINERLGRIFPRQNLLSDLCYINEKVRRIWPRQNPHRSPLRLVLYL
jgi:hypothetical protein